MMLRNSRLSVSLNYLSLSTRSRVRSFSTIPSSPPPSSSSPPASPASPDSTVSSPPAADIFVKSEFKDLLPGAQSPNIRSELHTTLEALNEEKKARLSRHKTAKDRKAERLQRQREFEEREARRAAIPIRREERDPLQRLLKASPRVTAIHDLLVTSNSLPKYRFDQVLKGIFAEKVRNWEDISNLPMSLRKELAIAAATLPPLFSTLPTEQEENASSLTSFPSDTSSTSSSTTSSSSPSLSSSPCSTSSSSTSSSSSSTSSSAPSTTTQRIRSSTWLKPPPLSNILNLNVAQLSDSRQATKALFELHDGQKIEAVSMRFRGASVTAALEGHSSLCISSQAGCALACSFCATGAVGLKRQLSADEIVDQVLYFQQNGHEVDTISFMGMGEPLLNPQVFKALEILTNPLGMNISQRRISVSTVGIVPGISKLTEDFPQINLAFSLHSPFSNQRSELVPANLNYPLPEVLKVLDKHATLTGRKIFMAYLVLEGFNDTDDHVQGLIKMFATRPRKIRHLYHLNLLRYNPAFGIDDSYKKTSEDRLAVLLKTFEEAGLSVTARQSFGVDIDAACGQLFANYEQKKVRVPDSVAYPPLSPRQPRI